MKRVCLTPETYRRLDNLARVKAGMPIFVFNCIPEFKVFGRAEQHPIPVVCSSESGGMVIQEMFAIDIANYIDIDLWIKSSPAWLDTSKIPAGMIYDFLLWHEIAHVKHGDMQAGPHFEAKRLQAGWENMLLQLTELRADRYAWKHISPGKPMPPSSSGKTPQGRKAIESFDRAIKHFKRDFDFLASRKITPLPTDPERYIPLFHLQEGIPWVFDDQAVHVTP